MHSVMVEHKETGVTVVETDEDIVVEEDGEEVASFHGKSEEVIEAAQNWADGYAEARLNFS